MVDFHHNETAPSAVHQIDFFATTDPAGTATNWVAAHKHWLKTDNTTTPTWFECYRRNPANDGWILVWARGELGAYAEGDLLIVDANGRPVSLAIGGAGDLLTADGTTAAWVSRHSYVGYNTVGGSWETLTTRRVYAKKITVATACLLTDIQAYVQNDPNAADDQPESLGAVLFADSAGTPSTVLSYVLNPQASLMLDNTSGAGGDGVGRWLGLPIGRWVTAADYWIAVVSMDASITALQLAYDGSGSDRYYTAAGDWVSDWGQTTPTTGSNKYSIRAGLVR